MTEPQSEQPNQDAVAGPDAQGSIEHKKDEAVAAGLQETAANIHLTLTSGQQINVQTKPLIKEENLRELRKRHLDRKEVRDLALSDGAIIDARGGKDGEAVDKLVSEHIKRTEGVSMLFLRDAEAAFSMSEIDLENTRILVQLGHSYAKSLSAGKHNNPSALHALKTWQTKVAAQHPEAVSQLIESYKQTILAETTGEKPDLIWLRQWIDLCTGFAPELATELEAKYQEAIHTRCEYFIATVEAEFVKKNPDKKVIGLNIVVPPKYFEQLKPGSTIPDRVKKLEEQFAALKQK